MKNWIIFINVFIIIFTLTITKVWSIPLEDRKVRFMNDKFGRSLKKMKLGGHPYMKSAPDITRDQNQNFRYLHSKEWNIVEHRFAIQPAYRSFEEAARFYLKESAYGPIVGLNDEATELVFVSENILFNGSNYHKGRCFVRFKQVYQQIPVIGSEIIVEMNNRFELIAIVAKIVSDIDHFIESSNISTEPQISASEAEIFAKNRMTNKYQIVNENDIYVESFESGIYSQFVLGDPGNAGSLVWKFVLSYEDKKDMILVSANLPDTLVSMMSFSDSQKFLYHGKSGAICDTLAKISPDIQDTPGALPARMGAPFYSLGQDKSDGIYVNSGIGNKAAYLLIKGDNTTFNGKTVDGFGFEKSKALFDEAQHLLSISADYFDLYFALLQGCINLGYSNAECDEVMDAVQATEMNKEPRGYTPIHGISDKPECAGSSGLNSIFYDNFDSDNNSNWQISTAQGEAIAAVQQYKSSVGFKQSFANSQPGNMWIFAQKGMSDVSIEMALNTQTLPPSSYLFFNHAFIFDSSDSSSTHFNGGVIEYSIDGGASWHDDLIRLNFVKNPYNGSINSQTNPLYGSNAFVSKSDGYMATTIDLQELEGKNVRFRFRIATSADIAYYGWFIDDFQIYSCDMFLQMPGLCSNPSVTSTSAGSFSRIPGPGDILKIQAGHSVTINYDLKNFKGLCNYGTLKSSNRNLVVETSEFIYNVGKIWAADGQDGYWTNGFRRYIGTGDGKNVELRSAVIYNDIGGDIQAGRGGHSLAVTSPYYVEKRVDSVGGDGGDVIMNGDYIRNKGRIGPDLLTNNFNAWTLPEDLVPDHNFDGGNGGIADNGFASSTYCPGADYGAHCANYGKAIGGDGGSINIYATISIEHFSPGSLGGGNGGPARGAAAYLFWNSRNRVSGIGGNVVITAPKTIINSRIYLDLNNYKLSDRGGRKGANLHWDPILTIGGDAASITGVETMKIFGGENWIIDMENFQSGSFSANNIEIKLGSNGILKFGEADNVFSSYTNVSLYVNRDNILCENDSNCLNLSRKIARTFDAKNIDIYAPEIDYEFEIDIIPKESTHRKRRDISGGKNSIQEVYITVNNNGPTRDAYALEISYSNLIKVSSIPSFVRINPMSRKKIPVEVTLPEEAGEDYFVEVVAESCSTINKKKSRRVSFTVPSTIASLTITNNKNERLRIEANGTPISEDIVVTSWKWDMGDNTQPILTQKVDYVYKNEGAYVVKLTVTDSLGNSETIQKEVIVQNSKVLLLAADSVSYAKSSLLSSGLFVDSDITPMEHPSTIDIDQLLPYNAVLVWSSKKFHNPENIGDALAEYVRRGGGVVIAGYSFIQGLEIEGEFSDLFYPFETAIPQDQGLRDFAFSINIDDVPEPDHFIFSGITQNPSYLMDPSKTANLDLKNDAMLLAKDNLGNQIIAMHPTQNVIGMAILPTFLNNPQANLLLANALLHVSGEKSELVINQTAFDKSASAGNDSFQIIDKGNGTMFWTAKTDDHWIHIEGENSGISNGIINFRFDAYNDPDSIRMGKITVSALGAYNSPQIVQITQGQNQVPVLSDIIDQVVCEDAEINISITVSDEETLPMDLIVRARAQHINLVPDSGIRFSNPGKERTLTIRPAPNQNGVTTIFVTVSDGIRSTTKSFQLTVKAVNDAPYFTKGENIVLKRYVDTGAQTFENWILDKNPGFSNENFQELSFHVQAQNSAQFDVLPAISTSGSLTFDPKDNFSDHAVVSVYVSDNGGTSDGGISQSEPQLFTIYYAEDMPDFQIGKRIIVNEDAQAQIVTKWATHIDPGTNDSDIDVSFITVNSNPLNFSEQPFISSDGTLIYTPAPDQNGTVIVSTYLKDNKRSNKRSALKHFIIFIKPVNDPPSFEGSYHQSVEDAPRQYVNSFAQHIVKGPEDETSQNVTFHILNCSNPELFEEMPVLSSNGSLTYKPKPDAFGEAILEIKITDDGPNDPPNVASGNTEQCTITVKPVNDPPSFTMGQFPDYISEDSGYRKVIQWAKDIYLGPVNEQDQTPGFVVNNDNPDLFSIQPNISPEGDLEYETAPNEFGTAKISICLTDNGDSANGGNNSSEVKSFVMNVQPVCDLPTFIHGPNPTVNGPGTYTISDWATIIPGPFEDNFLNINAFCDDDRIDVNLFPNGTLIFTIPSNTYGDFKVSTIIQYRSPCDGENNHGLTTQVFYISVVSHPDDKFILELRKEGNGRVFKDNSELIMPWTSQFVNHSEVTLSVEGSFIHWVNIENNQIFNDNPLTLTINKNIQLKAVFDNDICFDFNLHEGFNPVSLPVSPSDNNVSSVLQSNDASAYRFSGNNYVPVNNLLTKIGYWVKLHESKKLTVCGPPIKNLNLELTPGFHFIGSVSTKQTPSTIPTDSIESIFIWKDNAWVEVTEMTPGLAHCVKIKKSCLFILYDQ